MLRVRELAARDDKENERYRAGDGQHRKAGGVNFKGRALGLEEHHEVQQHRADERADLVEHLLNAEALADALLRCGKGHDGIFRGLLYRLAHALDDQQHAGRDPAVLADEGESGDGDDIQHVADYGHRPILLGLIRQLAEHIAHRVADQLAETGDEAYRRRRSAEQGQVRAAYA